MNDKPQHTIFDVSAIAVILGTFAGYLPAVAAGFAVLWYARQLYLSFRDDGKK